MLWLEDRPGLDGSCLVLLCSCLRKQISLSLPVFCRLQSAGAELRRCRRPRGCRGPCRRSIVRLRVPRRHPVAPWPHTPTLCSLLLRYRLCCKKKRLFQSSPWARGAPLRLLHKASSGFGEGRAGASRGSGGAARLQPTVRMGEERPTAAFWVLRKILAHCVSVLNCWADPGLSGQHEKKSLLFLRNLW